MSYINIFIKGAQEPIKKYITSEVYPFVIFHEHIKNIQVISMYKNDEPTSDYIVTLYTKKYLIHLDRVTRIDSVPAADEQIHVNESTLLNLHTVDFYKGTVTLRQNVEDYLINKIIPLDQSNTGDNDDEIIPLQSNTDDEIIPLPSNTSDGVKPYDDGTLHNCSELLTKCEQRDNKCKSSLEQIQKEYQSSLELIQKDHDSILEQNQKQYLNEITKQRKFYEKERDRTSEECGNRIYEYNNDRALCYEREKGCINENFKLNLEITELKKQTTPNISIIICVGFIILLLGLCIYLYFFKR